MRDFVKIASELIGEMSAEEFRQDVRTHQAVYALVIKFGEASAILLREHKDVLDQFPELPARSASDMRNRLVHGYWHINLDILYDIAKFDLPQCDPILQLMENIYPPPVIDG